MELIQGVGCGAGRQCRTYDEDNRLGKGYQEAFWATKPPAADPSPCQDKGIVLMSTISVYIRIKISIEVSV